MLLLRKLKKKLKKKLKSSPLRYASGYSIVN
jgi:hypothetical protein